MASLWTLKWNGTEKELWDWGITADFAAELANKDEGVMRLRTVESFDAGAAQWTAFKAWLLANPTGDPTTQVAKVYRDRTAVGAGGTLYFQGFFDDPMRLLTEEGRQYIEYRLYDVLGLFKRNPFKQYRKQFAGFVTPGVFSSGRTYVNVVCPEIFIGDNYATGTLFKQHEQLTEIINWVNECYNPTRQGALLGMDAAKDVVQIGTLNPAAKIPKYRANTIHCLEAANIVTRWTPDAFFKLDRTTTPPTLSVLTAGKWNYATTPPTFIDYSNLTEVTINITTDQEKEIKLQGTSARKFSGVIIYYRVTDTVDGVTVPVLLRDAYVPGIDVSFGVAIGAYPADFLPEVPSHFVELEGQKLTHVRADVTIEAQPIADVVSGTAATRAAWWLAHDKTLASDKVDAASIVAEVAEVVDDAGAAITLADYPNVLAHDSHIPKWMKSELGIRVIRAHVKAGLAFDKYHDDDQNILDHKVKERQARKTVKLTNAVTQTYEAVKSFEEGEAVPEGVAESVYRGAAIDQWNGSISFTNAQLRADVYIGCRLKLVGPTTTFTNVIPQMINVQPHHGNMSVQYGPTAPPDAEGLIELARATRNRIVYNMPSGRDDGTWGGGSSSEVDDSSESPLNDTAHQVGGNQVETVFTPIADIE